MSFDDLFWNLRYQSQRVQGVRADVRGTWQDEAAREIAMRYLEPHAEDDEKMQAAVQRQIDALSAAAEKIRLAKAAGQRVEEHAFRVADHLQHVRQDLQSCHSLHDQFVGYNSISRGKIPEVEELIRQANKAGA